MGTCDWLVVCCVFHPFWDSFVIHPETCHNPMQPSMAMLRNMFPWKAGMQVSHWQTRTEATKISTKSLWCLFFCQEPARTNQWLPYFSRDVFVGSRPFGKLLAIIWPGAAKCPSECTEKTDKLRGQRWEAGAAGKLLQRYMQCLIWRTCSFSFGIPKRAG